MKEFYEAINTVEMENTRDRKNNSDFKMFHC
jgi:hypothetical protein